MTFSVIGRLFRGKASMKTMSGPLDIAKFSGEAARTGAVPLVALMAAISLQLGIFNLLPIPVLDGGHLFLLTIEGIVRRDFSLRVKERILQFGFLMILALADGRPVQRPREEPARRSSGRSSGFRLRRSLCDRQPRERFAWNKPPPGSDRPVEYPASREGSEGHAPKRCFRTDPGSSSGARPQDVRPARRTAD